MSAPSSDGRPSVSSELSVASSPTLISRNSAVYADNGEGSSSPDTGSANGAGRSGSDSLRAVDAVQEQDFARRKQRIRRSGGFLLDSNFSRGPQTRHDETHHTSAGQEARSRKRLSPSNSPLSREVQLDGQSAAGVGSRLDSAGSHEQNNSQLRVGKTRKSAHLMPSTAQDRGASPNSLQRQTIDPNQLVHMALNLSESRRRNISTSQLLASQARITSGAQREGSTSNYGAGSSLRHYLNEQRRASRNISPLGAKGSPSRHVSTSMQRSGSMAFPGSQSINPSATTLLRVEKARAYIELRMEYLRLLEYLPPLKPDANAPGNFVISSSNVPGSSQAQLTRVPSYAGKQHDLGRPYNPLQSIRNRRTRARERRAFDQSPDEFADIEQVRDWVDRIEQYSGRSSYRRDDGVQLPKLHAEHAVNDAPSKPTRPHKGWILTPEELLADAHWLEQDDNKTLIENRHGRKIFPPRDIQKQDFLSPRASKEYPENRRRSWVEGLPGLGADPTTGDESEKGSERGRKRRLLPAIRTDSPKGGKHSRRGSRLRTKDDSDSSGTDTNFGKRIPRLTVDVEHNTGALALLLEQQTKLAQVKSPSIISPDTPDKWGRKDAEVPDNKALRDSLEVPRLENGSANLKDHGHFKVPPRTRTNANLSIDDTEPRSSFEEYDSTAPNTPLHSKRFPHIGDDLSPPQSRAGSKTRKPKRSKLNIFHSRETSEDYKPDYILESVGTDKQRESRQPSEETQDEKHIGTAILAAPGAVRNLLGHRKNDSVSSLPSPDKLRRRETQEPHSAVSRFFKGAKREGTKVGEFIFRRDRPDDSDAETLSDRNSVEFDTDASATDKSTVRPAISRAVTTESIGSKKNGRSHLDLPTFRPINQKQLDEETGSDMEHHITRQTRERKNSRSPRFNRLAPPRMDLGTISGNSSTTSLSLSRSHSQDRINKVLARPGGFSVPGLLPPTALRNAQGSDSRQRSSSRPTLDGKRHWSIADDDDEHKLQRKATNVVTQADIARVRALFLCSGVKAKEISRRAYTPRSSAPDFLARASATAKTQLFPVPKKEEHVLAARFLVKDLESSTKSLQASLENFRNSAIKDLTTQISQLQSRIDSDLMPRILDGGDKAVRITSEVSGQGPLHVKQITDEIDRMLRVRRRRMRWVRGLGWMLVEWALVAVMWWMWLVVVLVGSVKRVLCLGWGLVRWLLWL
ncbi:Nn.00g033690.m01.CDS01 [Neocucurbitaria sp. VM-36]